MTIEEAIKIVRGESVGDPVSCDEQINAAEKVADYAEKCLKQKEAWDKCEKEIHFIKEAEEQIYGHSSWNFIGKVEDVIDKHLKEVELN